VACGCTEGCSASLDIKGVMRPMVRCHLTPVGIAVIIRGVGDGKAGGDVGQALCTVGGNVGCCTHYRELYGELGMELPCVKWLTSGCMSE